LNLSPNFKNKTKKTKEDLWKRLTSSEETCHLTGAQEENAHVQMRHDNSGIEQEKEEVSVNARFSL
jgi:hypothetical protein